MKDLELLLEDLDVHLFQLKIEGATSKDEKALPEMGASGCWSCCCPLNT
ncbi:thiopeptide-type bacteriocin [Paenibacillus dendritiformis]